MGSTGKNPLRLPCWPPLRLKSKNKCWASDSSPLFKECTRIWPEKSPACCWKSTTPNCCTCWNTESLSNPRWKRPWPFSKLIRPIPKRANNFSLHEETRRNPIIIFFFHLCHYEGKRKKIFKKIEKTQSRGGSAPRIK